MNRWALRQREAVRRADAIGDRTDKVVHRWWKELRALLRNGPTLGLARLQTAITNHWRLLPYLVRQALSDGLVGLYQWGASSAAYHVVRAAPRAVLRRVYDRALPARMGGRDLSGRRSERGTLGVSAVRTAEAHLLAGGRSSGGRPLLEAPRPRRFGTPSALDFGRLMRDADPDTIGKLLLPQPAVATIRKRVDNLIAPFLSSPRPDLVDPRLHAAQLVTSYSQGRTIDEIAEDLLPIAENVRASARRVARTWGLDVAQTTMFEATEQLGADVVIGYRIEAMPNPDSREWHQERSGTVYYREPGQDQKGFMQMPRPPREAPDPNERPPGEPWLAWN